MSVHDIVHGGLVSLASLAATLAAIAVALACTLAAIRLDRWWEDNR